MYLEEIIKKQKIKGLVAKIIEEKIGVTYRPSPHFLGDCVKPPKYNVIFVPSDFSDEGGIFDFLDMNSDIEDLRQMVYYKDEVECYKDRNGCYIEEKCEILPFFVNVEGKIIGLANPIEMDIRNNLLDPIELNLPTETKAVLIAIGHPEELMDVKKDFNNKRPTNVEICWAVYG